MKQRWYRFVFLLFWSCIACGETNDIDKYSSTDDTETGGEANTDSNDGTGANPVTSCSEEAFSCNGNMLMRCVDGNWQEWSDCAVIADRCTVVKGTYQCVGENTVDSDSETVFTADTDSFFDSGSDTEPVADSDSNSDTDSDTNADWDTGTQGDTVCDGEDKDCYADCWTCGMASAPCEPSIKACMDDTTCAQYYDCKETVCCDGSTCLVGADWGECMLDCRDEAGATAETIELYRAIDKCVACDACAISCGKNESSSFAMCADPNVVNSADGVCFTSDAVDDETGCYEWAMNGGPCTVATDACRTNAACSQLENCVNDSWDDPENWESIQKFCFDNAGPAVTNMYWAFIQCIFCDACDLSCLTYASPRNCDEYTGK